MTWPGNGGGVDVSPEDGFAYEQLATTLLDDALREYDHFVGVEGRRVDPRVWKHWQQHDDVAMYRERDPHEHLVAAAEAQLNGNRRRPSQAATATRLTAFRQQQSNHHQQKTEPTKPMPRLLAIGAIRGTLDDVMYGLATPTAAAMRLQAAYLEATDFVDAAVLRELHGPTPSAPFQFLGLKWLLQRAPAYGIGLIRPRDYVFLESSGVHVRDDPSSAPPAQGQRQHQRQRQQQQQRVGFHLRHSVELAAVPEQRDRGVQRGAFSTVFLYHERPSTGAVDVYMTALVQARGHLVAPLALRAAASLLRANWRAVSVCAENKKLAWLLQTHRQLQASLGPRGGGGGGGPTPGASRSRCELCSKALGKFGARRATCELCAATVCGHCCVSRTLRGEGFAQHSVIEAPMVFCKKCIALASEESSSEIARQELWEEHVVRTGRTQTVLALAAQRPTEATTASSAALRVSASTGAASRMLVQRFSMGGTAGAMSFGPNPQHHHHHDRRTWHEPPPGSAHGVHQPQYRPSYTKDAELDPHGRRMRNETWSNSTHSRETEHLSLAGLGSEPRSAPHSTDDRRYHRYQHAQSSQPGDSSRLSVASTTSTALVLLDERSSTRRMKALDYLQEPQSHSRHLRPPPHSAPSERLSMASCSVYSESDADSESQRSSLCSSIAVMEYDGARVVGGWQPQNEAWAEGDEGLDDDPHGGDGVRQEDPEAIARTKARFASSGWEFHDHEADHALTPRHDPEDELNGPEAEDEAELDPLIMPRRRPKVSLLDHEDDAMLVRASEICRQSTMTETNDQEQDQDHEQEQEQEQEQAEGGTGRASEQRLSYQMQLWMQMNELRDTAESTYQVAKRNTETLLSQNPQYRSMTFFAPQPRLTVGRSHRFASVGGAPNGAATSISAQ